MPDRLWDRSTLEARIQNAPARQRYAGGSPDEKELFFVFKDRTTGEETYGAGRFLYADPPSPDRVVLDFNRAFNPPCAFTPFATCPLPPKQNWLPIRIEAGEKAYASSPGHGEPSQGRK